MNFKMNADFHSHTYFSDGKNSIAEMVDAASKMGLKTFGITDHGFWHHQGLKRKDVAVQRAEIERLRPLYPDMEILLGIEVNLINLKGGIDLKPEDFKLFDYVIFGVHKLPCSLKKPSSLWFVVANKMFKSEKRRQKVTDSYILALNKYNFKFVVHPNYATRVDVGRLANVAKERGAYIELNGKRIEMDEQDARELIESGVDIVISSDAHTPDRVAECKIPREFIKKYNIPLERIVNIDIEE